jgi:predicted permease
MPLTVKLRSFVRNLFSSRRVDVDLDQEVHSHLEMLIEENIGAGMPPKEAERAARIELGGVEQVKEQVRDARIGNWLHSVIADCRYGVRQLGKNPVFTTVAVLTLALGIGANTALFSVVNGVLLNPLPYSQPERLVALYSRTTDTPRNTVSYTNFLDWQRDNNSFSALAAFRKENFNLTGVGDAERLSAEMVSATFFPILGVPPIVGRDFTEQEDQVGGAPVALISEGLWKRKFDSSPDAIGKPLTLNGTLYTIIGVIPASFHYRDGSFHNNSEAYVPIGQWNEPLFRNRATSLGMDTVGRLKPGVTLEQANSDMSGVAARLAQVYPGVDKNAGIALVSLKENVVGDIQPFLLVLLAAVGFVLLISCANVANLLLARCTGRTREFAVRTALGATSGRLVRQLLTESILLSLAGGTLGLFIAAECTRAAIKVLPEALPRAEEIHLDGRVLLFTLAVSVFAGILFGLVPAFKTSRTEIHETLKESGRGGSGARHHTQTMFVAVEMAMALVLLVGAGLMIRSLAKLWQTDPGLDPSNVVSFNLASSQPLGATPSAIRAAYRQLHDAISAVPGVQAVSMSAGALPLSDDSELAFWMEGEPQPASLSEMKATLFYATQADYLRVMKTPLKRGRFLTESDNENAPFAVVIDDQFAKLYFGDKDPIGRHVNFEPIHQRGEVVGVVGHVKQWGLDSDAAQPIQAQCYFPLSQIPDSALSLINHGTGAVVRTGEAPLSAMDSIGHAVESVNNQIVVYGTETMTDVISDSLAAKRFAMVLLGVFAALAMLLSSIGIYGVISYVVGQRTHEFGIRIALGAARGNVLRMVLQQAGRMVLLGVVIGLVAAFALTRLMASMLFGVSSHDPLTFLGVAVLLGAVALAACYIPPPPATRVDPIIALRYE